MRLCLNQITIGRRPPASVAALARDLEAARDGGWTAVELWLSHWDGLLEREPGAARRALGDAGLVAAGGCAQPGLFFSTGDDLQRYREHFRRRLEQCQALGASHLVITPGTPGERLPETPGREALAQGAANVRAAAELAAPYGVRLGIEFLKGARLVENLATAAALAREVDHPGVGVVVDTFHLYAGTSKLEDFDDLRERPDRLGFVHLNDVPAGAPREAWTDADRVLPGEGDLPLGAIVDRLRGLGYEGDVSLELFNEAFAGRWEAGPVAAAGAAYRSAAGALERVAAGAGEG